MTKFLFLLGFLVYSGTSCAQRFTLDKKLFEDTLFLNYQSYGEINITSSTVDSMSIKARVFKNTVDNYAFNSLTFDTTFAYLHYGYCGDHYGGIWNEGLCTLDKNTEKISVQLWLENKDNNRPMELCLEFFDVLDSTYRDTACFKYYGKNDFPTGLRRYNSSAEFKVFPNPATNSVTVQNSVNLETIQILDLSGKVLMTFDNVQTTSQLIDLNAFGLGLFILRCESENGPVINRKLIIQ